MRSGDGGDGGSASATATSPGGTTAVAAGATALARPGGAPGLVIIRANGQLSFGPGTTVQVGNGGNGGDGGEALATGAAGRAAGASPSQQGGIAVATGGNGGDTPNLQVIAAGNVVGAGSVFLSGGHAGFGGRAVGFGGVGGAGGAQFPDGADGGALTVTGGRGGNAGLLNFSGLPFGMGGRGGDARMELGNGGTGNDGCRVPPGILPGGAGGKGGLLTGTHGAGGTGLAPGADGIIELNDFGRGGRGGNGWPGGTGGQGGFQSLSRAAVIISFGGATNGLSGANCFGVLSGSTGTGYTRPAPGSPPSCRTPNQPVEFVSFVDQPVTFTVLFEPGLSTGAQFFTFGQEQFNAMASTPSIMGTTPDYDPQVHGLMGARAVVYSFYDFCATSGPFTNAFSVTATIAGGTGFQVGSFTHTLNP